MATHKDLSASSYATNSLWKAKEVRTLATKARRTASATRNLAKTFEPHLSTAELHTLADAVRILDALGHGLEVITHTKAREEAKRQAEHEQRLREERQQAEALLFAGKTNDEIRAECARLAAYLNTNGWAAYTLERYIRYYSEHPREEHIKSMRREAIDQWIDYIKGGIYKMSPEGYSAFKQQQNPAGRQA